MGYLKPSPIAWFVVEVYTTPHTMVMERLASTVGGVPLFNKNEAGIRAEMYRPNRLSLVIVPDHTPVNAVNAPEHMTLPSGIWIRHYQRSDR
jgi:hypothetical protein